MIALSAHIFHQVGHGIARGMVEKQFDSKPVKTRASKDQHMKAFEANWAALLATFLGELTPRERELWVGLDNQNAQDAFRIIKGWARFADKKRDADFPVSTKRLGQALELTSAKGAAYVRDRLVAAGIIQKTAECQPHKKAGRYRWICT